MRKLVFLCVVALSVAIGPAHSEQSATRGTGEVLNLLSCAGQKHALGLFREAGPLDREQAAASFGLTGDAAAKAVVGREAKAAIVDGLAADCGGGPQPVTCVGSQCFCFLGNDCNTLATSCPTQLTCTEIGCSCDLSGG